MTSRKSILRFSAMFLIVISTSITAQEPNGVSKFRDVKAPGAIETDTYAVNNFGVIAGDFVDANNVQHGMILNGSKLTTVDRPGCLTTPPGPGAIALFGIASKGAAVGWCQNTKTGLDDAFLYLQGRFTNIAFPGAVSTLAQGINDKNQIVGTYIDTAGAQHGFLLTGAKYAALDVPGHTSSNAWSINNEGVIAIFAVNKNNHYDSFLFNGVKYTPANVTLKGVTDSLIHGVDNFGERVYTVFDSAGSEHGVLFLKGRYYEFNDPNDKSRKTTRADGLSDKLEIVGRYSPSLLRPDSTANIGFAAYGCCR